ncbi:MAG: hypothetical protein AB7Q00_15110 [Phycisphaerales bacterium]
MSDPATASFVALGASGGADAASAYANAYSLRSQAKVNAMIATAEAQDARKRGNTAAAVAESKSKRQAAGVKSQIAGSGFTVGVGTATDLEGATELIGKLDAYTIRENARKETLSHQLAALGARTQADSIRPGQQAFSTLIGSAAKAGASYAMLKG